jgi:hypothetical protein
MAETTKNTLVEKLIDSFPTLPAVFGVALIILGMSGGITYKEWFPSPMFWGG